MKVILVNGSPHANGCTVTALNQIAEVLKDNGIETEMFHIGTKPISGCLGCQSCFKTGRCVINDVVNTFLDKVSEADGFIFGSPVHYAAISGALSSFMDRAFYGRGSLFAGKPAAGIVSCRRGGAVGAFDQLNKYFSICSMPIVTSSYWNQVHGTNPDEVVQDIEGMQTMRILGKNMAWLLKCIEAGKGVGIEKPEPEPRTATNFIH